MTSRDVNTRNSILAPKPGWTELTVVPWGTVTGEGGKGFAKELGKGQEMGKLEEVKDERNIRQPVFFGS